MLKSIFVIVSFFIISGFSFFEKPIVITVPFSVGGPTDIIARRVELAIEKYSDLKIAVINQGGASGNIGLKEFNKKSNGLLFTTENIFTNKKYLNDSYPHGLTDNILPIYFFGKLPNIIYANYKIKDFQHLIFESEHRDIIIGSAAPGSGSFETYYQLCQNKNVLKKCRLVVYKSAGEAALDLMAGRLDMYSSLYPAYNTFAGLGTVNPIVVLSKNRLTSLPTIPSIFEFGFEIENISWHALFEKGIDTQTRVKIKNALDIYFTLELKRDLGYETIESDFQKFWIEQKNYYENIYGK